MGTTRGRVTTATTSTATHLQRRQDGEKAAQAEREGEVQDEMSTHAEGLEEGNGGKPHELQQHRDAAQHIQILAVLYIDELEQQRLHAPLAQVQHHPPAPAASDIRRTCQRVGGKGILGDTMNESEQKSKREHACAPPSRQHTMTISNIHDSVHTPLVSEEGVRESIAPPEVQVPKPRPHLIEHEHAQEHRGHAQNHRDEEHCGQNHDHHELRLGDPQAAGLADDATDAVPRAAAEAACGLWMARETAEDGDGDGHEGEHDSAEEGVETALVHRPRAVHQLVHAGVDVSPHAVAHSVEAAGRTRDLRHGRKRDRVRA